MYFDTAWFTLEGLIKVLGVCVSHHWGSHSHYLFSATKTFFSIADCIFLFVRLYIYFYLYIRHAQTLKAGDTANEE